MSVGLPKDAEGREIPLDTEMLYGEDGKCFEVDCFVYSVRQTIPGLKWEVVLMSCIVEPCTTFYLTPPEPPDSWEKLEEDLDRCVKGNSACMYYSEDGTCQNCTIRDDSSLGCSSKVLEDIKKRICMLRGEDE